MKISLPHYTPEDYRADIARDTQSLARTMDEKERAFLELRIRTAQSYIADPAPSFKW